VLRVPVVHPPAPALRHPPRETPRRGRADPHLERALLCRFHHRLLHAGWTLDIVDGQWVATDPHGTTWTGRPRAPDPATAKIAS